MADIQRYTTEATKYKLCTKVDDITYLVDMVQEEHIGKPQSTIQNTGSSQVSDQVLQVCLNQQTTRLQTLSHVT